mmetsp:Transcript_13778/g.29418  ORF Transcript_13778/g.29418 Transcript_13778/m.29418 type:complete len:83 (-) Transcript_13778:245-493(-)
MAVISRRVEEWAHEKVKSGWFGGRERRGAREGERKRAEGSWGVAVSQRLRRRSVVVVARTSKIGSRSGAGSSRSVAELVGPR